MEGHRDSGRDGALALARRLSLSSIFRRGPHKRPFPGPLIIGDKPSQGPGFHYRVNNKGEKQANGAHRHEAV